MSAFDALADEQRWVAWRNEPRGDKPTKVPYAPDGRKARADDPSTWGTRKAAEARASVILNGLGGGIGIQLGDLGADTHLAGIDFDCSLINGAIAPWALAILKVVDTYAEVSPSGNGLKAYFYITSEDVRWFLNLIGVRADGWGCKRGVPGYNSSDHGPAVEVYASHRFFAVTERRWLQSPDRIGHLDRDSLKRLAKLVPPPRAANENAAKPGGGDTSRSGKAWRIGLKMRHAGKTFEEFCDAVRTDPDTVDWCREKGESFNQRELHRIWNKAAKKTPGVALSEDDLALEFTDRHANDLLYVHLWGSWLHWNGRMWVREKTLKTYDLARIVARETPGAAKSAKTVAAIENLARSDRQHARTHDSFDLDPLGFNEGEDCQ